MTRFPRFALTLVALLCLSLTLSAQTKHRSVAHPGNAAGDVSITGVITDAATGLPISGALVRYNDRASNVTGADGKFSINVPASLVTLTVEQFAYGSQEKTITAAPNLTVNFSLTSKSQVSIRLKSGETKRVVYDTARFAFLIPFSGYVQSDQVNLCKPDGSGFTPGRTEIAQITGPINEVTFTPCCDRGPVVSANFRLKNGQTTTGYFVDSCFGNDVVIMGRDPGTGAFTYVSFKDVAQVDFP
jgi:hypothetical protein